MGCPGSVFLADNLTFSICTHDADTGALADTSAPPAYRVYEDETAVAILTGTMAKLDDANTLGFYTELLACTTANGFEVGKSYTVYIEATVDGITGGIAYGFTVANVAAIADAILDEVITEPAGMFAWATGTLRQIVGILGAFARNKQTLNKTTGVGALRTDADTGNISTRTDSDDSVTYTRGEAS